MTLHDATTFRPSAANHSSAPATATLAETFAAEGHLFLPKSIDRSLLEQIRSDVGELIRHQMRCVPSLEMFANDPSYDAFEEGILALARAERGRVGAVYDASMKLVSTRALGVAPSVIRLVEELLGSKLVSISNNIIVRIDLPHEDRFLFDYWHQDYPYSMVSRRGVVLWIPLSPIPNPVGPVEVLPRSHVRGVLPVEVDGKGGFRVADEEFLSELTPVKNEADLGDVVAFDLLTAHRSSPNRSRRARWTLSFRYCDMNDEASVREGWPCFYSQGKHFTKVHPEYVLPTKAAG